MACYIYKIDDSLGFLSESIANREIAIASNFVIHSGDNVLGYLNSGYFTMLLSASQDSDGNHVFLKKDLEIGNGIDIDDYEDLKNSIITTVDDSFIPIEPEKYEEIATLMSNSIAINRRGDTEVNKEEILNNIKTKKDSPVTAKRVEFNNKSMPFNYLVFGAPGTGKSHHLKKALQESSTSDDRKAFGDNDERCERVTFYSGYSYGNFVGSYKPIMKDAGDGIEKIAYEFVAGPLARVLASALKDKDHNYLLIVEEINRAEAAAAFGDMFQLLDRKNNGESEYTIQTSKEMRRFLASFICDGFDKLDAEGKKEVEDLYSSIQFPSNMYIWSTMNSADQGVYPLDTAFKRRWTYKYIEIDDGEKNNYGVEGKDVSIDKILVDIGKDDEHKYVKWNDIRKAINGKLTSLNINEDKLMGPFFLSFDKASFSGSARYKNDNKEEDLFIYNGKDYNDFKSAFKSKVIMYLFDDAAKMKRKDIFNLEKEKMTYHEICKTIDASSLEVLKIEVVSWNPVNTQ